MADRCPACGSPYVAGIRFCAQCGISLSRPIVPASSQPTPGPAAYARRVHQAGTAVSLTPGTVLDNGRYTIVRVMSAGNFGTVYEATNQRLGNRPCAIKELHAATAQTPDEQAECEAWFAREAQLLMDLLHPMIPRIWDQFAEKQRFYLVMDLVAGQDLAQEMGTRGAPLAEREVLEWGIALCNVLAYLHDRQPPVIFRDMKPANVMRTPTGALYLIDFGIARVLDAPGTGGASRPGTMIGTPGYAPLEQYQGLPEPRSDIYALGATLHALLTGYDPERGQPLTFPPARQLRPDLHDVTETVLARAVALKPANRFPDARAFARALTRSIRSLQPSTPRKKPGARQPSNTTAPSVGLARASAPAFRPGDRVTHTVFGEGTVRRSVTMDADEEITVTFDSVGGAPAEKKLMVAVAGLHRLAGTATPPVATPAPQPAAHSAKAPPSGRASTKTKSAPGA